MPGATTKITIASNITYEVQATTKTTLFLAGAEIIEAEDVFYQETEPQNGSSTYVAWYNPKANEWKFKSNDTGNVFRTVRATPIADVYVDGSNITRIDYIGYRVFNDTIYATKDDLDTVSNSVATKQDALTAEQLNAVNSGITETNFNELNTEVETIKNDQETLGNDLGSLSNLVGDKTNLPYSSQTVTKNIGLMASSFQTLLDAKQPKVLSESIKIGSETISTVEDALQRLSDKSYSYSYSTNETFTGKYWVDGKKIYSKIINVPAQAVGTKVPIDLSSLNISIPISIKGMLKFDANYYVPVSASDESTNELNVYVMIQDNKLNINTGAQRAIFDGSFIILEYTKV